MGFRTRPSGWRFGKSLYEHRAHSLQHGSVLGIGHKIRELARIRLVVVEFFVAPIPAQLM